MRHPNNAEGFLAFLQRCLGRLDRAIRLLERIEAMEAAERPSQTAAVFALVERIEADNAQLPRYARDAERAGLRPRHLAELRRLSEEHEDRRQRFAELHRRLTEEREPC